MEHKSTVLPSNYLKKCKLNKIPLDERVLWFFQTRNNLMTLRRLSLRPIFLSNHLQTVFFKRVWLLEYFLINVFFVVSGKLHNKWIYV